MLERILLSRIIQRFVAVAITAPHTYYSTMN